MSEKMTPDQVNDSLRQLMNGAINWGAWVPDNRIGTVTRFDLPSIREDNLARVDTLSAAHRLISSFAEQTASRAELEECRDVMAKLERMVGGA